MYVMPSPLTGVGRCFVRTGCVRQLSYQLTVQMVMFGASKGLRTLVAVLLTELDRCIKPEWTPLEADQRVEIGVRWVDVWLDIICA